MAAAPTWVTTPLAHTPEPRPWLWVAAGLSMVIMTLLVGMLDPVLQASLAWREPLDGHSMWRAFSAAWVHWGVAHRWSNVVAALGLVWLGWTMRMPWRGAGAWMLAWPVSQLGAMLARVPSLHGGLSGWLHAGVAVIVFFALLAHQPRRFRALGLCLLAGLVAKLCFEAWHGPRLLDASLRAWSTPEAHIAGAVAGVACAALLQVCRRRDRAVP